MAGINSGGTLLNPFQDYGNGIRYNYATGRYETTNGNSSATLSSPLASAISSSLGNRTSNVNNEDDTSFFKWAITPLGGAGTKSPFEIGLNSLSGFANLWGSIYSSNKQIDELKATRKANEQYQLANLTNNASTQIGNMTHLAIAANDWSKKYGQQVAQNYAGVGQTMTNAVGALGGDTSGLQNQINNLSKYSALQV